MGSSFMLIFKTSFGNYSEKSFKDFIGNLSNSCSRNYSEHFFSTFSKVSFGNSFKDFFETSPNDLFRNSSQGKFSPKIVLRSFFKDSFQNICNDCFSYVFKYSFRNCPKDLQGAFLRGFLLDNLNSFFFQKNLS